MVNRFTLLVLSFVLLASMVGCGSSQVQPTNTPVPTSTSVPTATTIPTNTILPTNTAIPTATVIPTATPVPPTPTFSPADPVQTLEANGFVLQDTTCDSTCAYYWNEQHFIMAGSSQAAGWTSEFMWIPISIWIPWWLPFWIHSTARM